jgi:hypothetical protein
LAVAGLAISAFGVPVADPDGEGLAAQADKTKRLRTRARAILAILIFAVIFYSPTDSFVLAF